MTGLYNGGYCGVRNEAKETTDNLKPLLWETCRGKKPPRPSREKHKKHDNKPLKETTINTIHQCSPGEYNEQWIITTMAKPGVLGPASLRNSLHKEY